MIAPETKGKSKGKGGTKKGTKGGKKAASIKVGLHVSALKDAHELTDADADSATDIAGPKGAQATGGVGAVGLSCVCPLGASCASCGSLTAPSQRCCAKCATAQGKRLLRAAHDGCAKEVRQLLRDGVDPNFTYDSDWTALHRAVANGHVEVVSALLKEGKADVEATTGGFAPLHLAAHHDRSGRCAFLLVAAGADANRSTALGRTPLHYAAEAGNVAALQELLAAGACRTAKDAKGWTPVDVAKNATVRKILHKL